MLYMLLNWALFNTVIFSGSFEWSVAFMISDPKLLYLSRSCVQFLLFKKNLSLLFLVTLLLLLLCQFLALFLLVCCL
jgi:hypothetical protein